MVLFSAWANCRADYADMNSGHFDNCPILQYIEKKKYRYKAHEIAFIYYIL